MCTEDELAFLVGLFMLLRYSLLSSIQPLIHKTDINVKTDKPNEIKIL